jgi:hypothetical protein
MIIVVLIILGLTGLSLFIFAMIKISISCMFWCSKKPKDKIYVFKVYFPYYIIILFGLCITGIIKCNVAESAIYFFSGIFFLALLIWKHEMKSILKKKQNKNFAVEPNHPNLP